MGAMERRSPFLGEERLSDASLETSLYCRDSSGFQQLSLCAEGGGKCSSRVPGAFPAPLALWDLYQLTSRFRSSVFETWIGSVTKGFLLVPFLQKERDKLAQD